MVHDIVPEARFEVTSDGERDVAGLATLSPRRGPAARTIEVLRLGR